ncbi:MAG: hypothetical protein AB1489_25110 [Acidobacteriota bacterium]
MSANPKVELEEVKRAFEKFRAGRTGKERIPETLWATAVGLLAYYPLNVIWRELALKPDYLKMRAGLANKEHRTKSKNKSSKCLSLKASELTAINNGVNNGVNKSSDPIITAASFPHQNAGCRLIIERVDGSRLQLNLPTDWQRIQELCNNFLRG